MLIYVKGRKKTLLRISRKNHRHTKTLVKSLDKHHPEANSALLERAGVKPHSMMDGFT